jgi:hypothetical protein
MNHRLHRLGKAGAGELDGGETIQQRGATPARANQDPTAENTFAILACRRSDRNYVCSKV